jgi:hypothetical protein
MIALRSARRRMVLPALLAALALTAGCAANTGLSNMWRDPEFNGPPLRNVVVVAIRRNNVQRRLWEDGFAEQFDRYGVRATPSYRLFPEQVPDTSQLLGAIADRGFDGVLITRRAGSSTEDRYVPGYVTTRPVTYRSPWTGWYHTAWTNVYEPGYVETDRLVYNDVELWDLRDTGDIVWAGTTHTLNPSSSAEVNDEISKVILPELARQGFVPRR